jgi:hypothetical protein
VREHALQSQAKGLLELGFLSSALTAAGANGEAPGAPEPRQGRAYSARPTASAGLTKATRDNQHEEETNQRKRQEDELS